MKNNPTVGNIEIDMSRLKSLQGMKVDRFRFLEGEVLFASLAVSVAAYSVMLVGDADVTSLSCRRAWSVPSRGSS